MNLPLRLSRLGLVALLGGLFLNATFASADPPAKGAPSSTPATPLLSLKVEQYQLDNGLTVLLSPDPRVPIVATEIVYLVGSAYEEKGRTGFAHLFEHLMFQGSEHHDSEYFEPFEVIGAEVNGTTDQDRTNYYEHVPAAHWKLPLFMESDRMRSLLPVLTQEKLDNQRAVVKNERRQRYEVTPYGMTFWHLNHAMYPEGHPYHHSTIGSHEDLEAASLEDVKSFFSRYYVPANAGLVMTGDFDPNLAKAEIEKYFGDIPSGGRAAVPNPPAYELPGFVHQRFEDDVELPRVLLAFHSPALYAAGDAELDLLSSILSDGKSSRLTKALVLEKKLAADVHAFQMSERLGSLFVVQATAMKGVSVDALADALVDAVEKALREKPTAVELDRAKNTYKKGFYHRVESVGDRASLIGTYFLHTGRGDFLASDYERYVKANAESVFEAAKKTLNTKKMLRLDAVPGKKTEVVVTLSTPVATPSEPKSPKSSPETQEKKKP